MKRQLPDGDEPETEHGEADYGVKEAGEQRLYLHAIHGLVNLPGAARSSATVHHPAGDIRDFHLPTWYLCSGVRDQVGNGLWADWEGHQEDLEGKEGTEDRI